MKKYLSLMVAALMFVVLFCGCHSNDKMSLPNQDDFISQMSEKYTNFEFQIIQSSATPNDRSIKVESADINATNVIDAFGDILDFIFDEESYNDFEATTNLSIISMSIYGAEGRYSFQGEPVSYHEKYMGYTQWRLTFPEEIRKSWPNVDLFWEESVGEFRNKADETFDLSDYVEIDT